MKIHLNRWNRQVYVTWIPRPSTALKKPWLEVEPETGRIMKYQTNFTRKGPTDNYWMGMDNMSSGDMDIIRWCHNMTSSYYDIIFWSLVSGTETLEGQCSQQSQRLVAMIHGNDPVRKAWKCLKHPKTSWLSNEFDWERSEALRVTVVWFPVSPRAISPVAQVSEVPVFHETMFLSTSRCGVDAGKGVDRWYVWDMIACEQ